MTSEQKELTLGRLSSETVREATARGWEEWLEVLDAAGAADWAHGQIVAHLEREHREATTSWWRQSITVGYAGLRQAGGGRDRRAFRLPDQIRHGHRLVAGLRPVCTRNTPSNLAKIGGIR